MQETSESKFRLELNRKTLAAAVALLLSGNVALAQAPRDGLEEVVVTGSFLRRAADSASPLSIISQEDMRYTPRSSIGEILHADPAFSGSNVFTSFGTGLGTSTSATINLRGLGPRATLVMLNGGRSVNNSQPNRDGVVTFDVNSLVPAIAIERIEVLKDGASALYGTDAVAGVVNFITRNDFEGVELETSWQQTDVGGAEEFLVAGIMGHGNDSGHMMLAFEHLERDPFDYLAHADAAAYDAAYPSLSNNGSPGSFRLIPGQTYNPIVPPGADNRLIRDPLCGDPSLGSGPVPGVPAFLGPPANNNQICQAHSRLGRAVISGVERTSLYGHGEYSLGQSVAVGAEMGFTRAEFDRAAGFGRATPETFLPASHPSNIFGGDVMWRGSTVGPPAGPDGPNIFTATTNTWRAALFANGNVSADGSWRWDTKVTWSVNEAFSQNRNAMPSRMENALVGLGGFGCDQTTGIPGMGECQYFNPFASRYLASPGDPDYNDQAIIDYVMPFGENISESQLVTATGIISGDAFQMAGGTAGIAFGYEFRNYGMKNDFDPVTLAGEFGGNREVPFDADRDENALFVELVMPVTEALELQVAGRYEDYETVDEFVPKLGMMWTPTDTLIVRGTYGKSFKAPGLVPMFATSAGLTDTVNVPGIIAGFPRTVTRPNPNLQPETGESFTAGVTLDLTDRLTLSIDYWKIDTDDITGQESAQLVVEEYAATGAHADRLTFDASGELTDIDLLFDNFSVLNTDGIDFSVSWDIDLGGMGELRLSSGASYLLTYEYQIREDQPIEDGLGRANDRVFPYPAPEWKVNTSLSWLRGGHYLRSTVRYIDGMLSDRLADDHPRQTDRSYTQVDLVYGYTFGSSGDAPLELRLAVNNVTDERPPFFSGVQLAEPGVYDSRGRNFSLGLTKTF